MGNVATFTKNTGSNIKADPTGAVKVIFVILLAVILIYAVFKFLKGLGKATELMGEFGPSTEGEKRETIEKSSYQDNLKWLTPFSGATAIGQTKKYKNVSDYLQYKGSSWDAVNKAADAIWKAKFPGYISETEVYNAVASLPTKAAISLMAMSFNQKYAKLWNGSELSIWLSKYLKLPEMETLTEIISKKPTV